MTYEANIDGRLLFYPNDEAYAVTNGVVESALSEAGSFEFDIPRTNPEYEDLEKKVRSAMIQVKQNGKEIFYGELREVTQNFNMTKHVYCVGELAFLFDSIQPQAHYQDTPFNMLKEVIRLHNNQVEERKRFEVGYVAIKYDDIRVDIFTNLEDTMTVLRNFATALGGCVRLRKTNGKRYVDIVSLENYGKYCTQEIQFGENLMDYAANISANDIATAVIPLGAKLKAEERTKDAVNGLDEYQTIKSINNGVDYVFNQSAVNRFGWVKVAKVWDKISDPAQLKKAGEEWLKSVQFETMELNINAFDGNILDINVDSFDVGDTVHAWAVPYGMDTIFPVRAKKTHINDIKQNLLTLGTTLTKSYTSQASNALNALEELLPQESEMLRQAKENAINMLNGSVGGHVIFKFDEDNKYVEQIFICDASTERLSTRKWVWNINGFGYMHRDASFAGTDDGWTELEVAITMDGQIVANFITTGELDASKAEITNLKAQNITTGTLSANRIGAGSISADKIAAGAISADKIAAGAISSEKISTVGLDASVIKTGKLDANVIDADALKVGGVASKAPDGSQVFISGGTIAITNTNSSYLEIAHKGTGCYVDLGGKNWACHNGKATYILDAGKVFDFLNRNGCGA